MSLSQRDGHSLNPGVGKPSKHKFQWINIGSGSRWKCPGTSPEEGTFTLSDVTHRGSKSTVRVFDDLWQFLRCYNCHSHHSSWANYGSSEGINPFRSTCEWYFLGSFHTLTTCMTLILPWQKAHMLKSHFTGSASSLIRLKPQLVASCDGCSTTLHLGCDLAHHQQITDAFANGWLFEPLTFNLLVSQEGR